MFENRNAVAPFAVAVITGGSSGIGKSFIELLAEARPGLPICNLSRRVPANFTAAVQLHHVPCDLAEPASRAKGGEEALRFIRQHTDRSKVLLINCAGLGSYGNFGATGGPPPGALIGVNVAAVVELTELLLPEIKARGGAIINVASTAGFQPTPYLATYGATKAFVLNWSLALHEELRAHGVPVQTLCPGPTRTGFFDSAGLGAAEVSPGLSVAPEYVVRASLRALARGRSLVVPGWKNRLITLFAGKLPRVLGTRLTGAVLRRQRLASLKAP